MEQKRSRKDTDTKPNFEGSFFIQYAIAIALFSAIYYGGYYHLQIVPVPASTELQVKLAFTIRCAFPMVLVLFVFIANVGNKRFTTAAMDPLGGHEQIVQVEKNVLTNTLEQFVGGFTLMLVAATYLDTVEKMKIIALYSCAFVVGRVLFRIGYGISPYFRVLGMGMNILSSVLMMGIIVYHAVLL